MRITVLHVLFPLSLVTPTGPARAQGAGPDSLTLDAVVARVLATHPAVRQATQGVQATAARTRGTRSAYYPDVDANGGYARVDPVASIDLPGQGAFRLYPANNYDAHVSVRQTVFDFGRRSTAVDYTRALGLAAEHRVTQVESDLAFETINVFYAILYLERSVAVQDEQIAALAQHLDVTQARLRTGSGTEFEVLTTQVRVSTARSQRVDVANALARAQVRLRGLMGLPPDAPLPLAGTFPVVPPSLNADSLVTLALAQRPELVLAHDAEAAAAVQHRLAGLGKRPEVDLGVTAGFKNGYVPDLNTMTGNWQAGVQVRIPLFDGFLTRSRSEETRADLEATREHTADLERRVTTEVRQALGDVDASLEKMQTTDLQVQQARAAVDMADARYAAGVVTNLDVLDAQTSLQEAELVWLRARYQFVLSRYELERALGTKVW